MNNRENACVWVVLVMMMSDCEISVVMNDHKPSRQADERKSDINDRAKYVPDVDQPG
jgi:hypothetical protein